MYGLKGFSQFINERDILKLRSGEKFSKEDLEQGLLALHGREYGRKEIYSEIEKLLGIKINDGSFQKIVDAGVLGKGTAKGKYMFTGHEGANSKSANEPEPKVNLDDMEVGAGKAKTLAKVGAKKSLKYKIPVSSKSGKFSTFVENVLLNMINTSNGQEKGSLLLKGDPGSGKTSSILQFADIVGMDIITIEAPHVSEDAIISVPYLVKSGLSKEQKVMEMTDKGADIGFEVISAESALISDLRNKKPMTQANWDKAVNKYQHIAAIREQFKRPINNIRKTYNKILFIDELYRTGSKRIQNLFRTILNGYLGDTPIPKNIFIIFASNMDNTDGCWAGKEEFDIKIYDKNIQSNLQFKKNSKKYYDNLKEKNIMVKPLEKYINAKTKILHRCTCGNEWMVEPSVVLQNVKCGSCRKMNYLKDLQTLGIEVVPLEEYKGAEYKILHRCVCGNEWKVMPHKVKQGIKCGCGKEIPFTRRHDGIPTILYYIKIGNKYKIGITKVIEGCSIEENIINHRFRKDKKLHSKIKVLRYKIFEDGADALNIETAIKNKYKNIRYKGPDILTSGNTELFESELKGVEKWV